MNEEEATTPVPAPALDDPGGAGVVGFYHAGVTVSEMDAALRFYRDGLGLPVVAEARTGGPHARRIWDIDVAPDSVRVVFLGVPGSDARIELFEFSGVERHAASSRPCDFGAGHLCLYVDDLAAVFARLTALGFGARSSEPVPIAQGPHAGASAAYMKDPDGYHVELYERPPATAAPAQPGAAVQ